MFSFKTNLFCVVLCLIVVLFGWRLYLKHKKENEIQCGVEASHNLIHQNPWLVFIEYYKGDRYVDIRCGATLLDRRHVVTAAHCVRKYLTMKYSSLKARLGEYDLASERDCVRGICADPVVRILITKAVIHSGYDGRENDIAVLKLAEDAPYTDFIRPICLPTPNREENLIFIASGWGELISTGGYSDIKKIVPLPLWKEQDCRRTYKHSILPAKVICAGGQKGIDTCRGDSGGPLALVRDKVELWGVTSQGSIHCGLKGAPGIYTSVIEHLDWIEEAIKT